MPTEIPFGFPDRESLVLLLDLPGRADSGYEWISCRAKIHVGGFNGSADLYLGAGDLQQLSDQLEDLYRSLSGKAELNTIEGQIALKLTGDGKGHIRLEGSLLDRCGVGNKLMFVIEYDQTLLWQTVSALRDVLGQIKSKATSITEFT